MHVYRCLHTYLSAKVSALQSLLENNKIKGKQKLMESYKILKDTCEKWKSEVKGLLEQLQFQKMKSMQDQEQDSTALNDMKLKFECLMKLYTSAKGLDKANMSADGEQVLVKSGVESTIPTMKVFPNKRVTELWLKLKHIIQGLKSSINDARMDVENLK